MQKVLKNIGRSCAHVMVIFCVALARMTPLRLARSCGRVLGCGMYGALVRHRRIAYESLAKAFSAREQIRMIAERTFILMGEFLLEMIVYAVKDMPVERYVRVEGEEHLKKAVSRGKGVVCVTAHFGNFPLMMYALAKKGYNVNTMLRPLRDERTGALLKKIMDERGVKPVFSHPRKQAVFDSLKCLERGELLFVLMDQNFGSGGIWVKFFGELAATPVGPMVLAARADSAIVPMYITRESSGRHVVHIEPMVERSKKSDPDEALFEDVRDMTRRIEAWVRQYPAQWSWLHRRWKARPTAEALARKFKVEAL
jgi:KDO2-lipid IV(A) lauroyltransferase